MEDMVEHIHVRYRNDGVAELKIPGTVDPQTEIVTAVSAPTWFGELLDTSDIILGKSQPIQGASGAVANQMRLGHRLIQTHKQIASLLSDAVHKASPITQLNSVEP